jgi:hypothetical protein
MPLHRFVVGSSTIVFNNASNSFNFNAFVPTLGAETVPITWVLNEAPYLLVGALGGFSTTSSEAIDLRFRLNGMVLGVFQFPRWTSHFVIIPTTRIVPIPRGVLTVSFSGAPVANNILVAESLTASDYFFLGPVVCHY